MIGRSELTHAILYVQYVHHIAKWVRIGTLHYPGPTSKEAQLANRYSTSYRMNRVLRDDRAALIVPIDHGLVWGRVEALEAPVQVMRRYIPMDITGFMVSTGIVKQSEVETMKPVISMGI